MASPANVFSDSVWVNEDRGFSSMPSAVPDERDLTSGIASSESELQADSKSSNDLNLTASLLFPNAVGGLGFRPKFVGAVNL